MSQQQHEQAPAKSGEQDPDDDAARILRKLYNQWVHRTVDDAVRKAREDAEGVRK